MIYGHDGFAGELGHVTVSHTGRVCGCGRKGCLETYVIGDRHQAYDVQADVQTASTTANSAGLRSTT
ncbi:MAG: ROK family protein [Alistipes indistinctus]